MTTDELLKEAKLRFSSDDRPGYSRKLNGDKFQYLDTNGNLIKDPDVIDRINKLAIPPAYTDVWICPSSNGYLQATGYDAKRRKQYRYHPLWNKASQEEKFDRLIEFAHHLPGIRQKMRSDLALDGIPRQKIIAAVVWLLENTLIRIGNQEYEKDNKSYGLTTLKKRHASILAGNKVTFQFKGKSGVNHKVTFRNKRIASILRRCRDLPGQDLFEYYDEENNVQNISSDDVNEYLKSATDNDITAKDFRTWGGTVLAAVKFDREGIVDEENEVKKKIVETVKYVASHLRNKPNTCRKYYIHPSVIDAYQDGFVLSNLTEILNETRYRAIDGLDDEENDVLKLIKKMVKFEQV
ncbi:MAG TPA: DNA topoisomerase IB [Patescibacteria group bacterium]|nr:DNA topoisomerase IB [Patescibacteria group bacterium]